jgi:hypothetical protein
LGKIIDIELAAVTKTDSPCSLHSLPGFHTGGCNGKGIEWILVRGHGDHPLSFIKVMVPTDDGLLGWFPANLGEHCRTLSS